MVKESSLRDMKIKYERIDRPVKYPRLEFKTGQLVMIVPKAFKNEQEMLEKKRDWILKKTKEIQEAKKRAREKYRTGNPELTRKELKDFVEGLVSDYTKKIGVYPRKIFFRSMKTKWGSCSSRGNLSFNTELRFLPRNLIEYIVYHEVLHLTERKHNDKFWRKIKGQFPDSNEKERELMDYWFFIQELNQSSEMPVMNQF